MWCVKPGAALQASHRRTRIGPAAGVAMDAKRAKINGMTRRKRYWGNKKDISSIILRVSPSSADGVKARMAVGPRATGNVRPLMRA